MGDNQKSYAEALRANTDQKLFATDRKIDLKQYQRLLREVEDVNREFMSLRTYVFPDPADHLNLFYYVMFPNDGVMSQMPIIGRFIIPPTYPQDPPVLHKFTKTGRYNADVYDGYLDRPEQMHSTMCFDILRPRSDSSTSWKETYTLSALFATLMQALVSMYVEQDYGGNHTEFVTMEKLNTMKGNCQRALDQWKHVFDPKTFPEIPRFEALPVPANIIDFGTDVIRSNNNNRPLIVSSQPFSPQQLNKPLTIGFDLSSLTPSYVFSIVLANSKTDMTGKNDPRKTILVRNGVTASAAKKLENKQTKWFYHGKPMNDGNMILYVTISANQFTICYLDADGKVIVHGDCPVSYLTPNEMGNLNNKGPFYLNIFLKKKNGQGTIEIPIIAGPDGPRVGFIHNPEHAQIQLPAKPEINESVNEITDV